MKKVKKCIIIISIFCCVLLNISNATASMKNEIKEYALEGKTDVSEMEHYVTYSTDKYVVKLPVEYTKNSDGEYIKEFSMEDAKYIAIYFEIQNINEETKNTLKGNVYEKEVLEEIKKSFLEEVPSAKINLSNICNITKKYYKAFHLNSTVNLDNGLIIFAEEYYVVTENYVTRVTMVSTDEDYLNSNELYSIINNIEIKDTNLLTEVENEKKPIFTDEEIFAMIFNLILTIIIYCMVPTIMKLVHGPYDDRKAKRISLINSIILSIVFIITDSIKGNNLAPAFFYYFVNKWILTKLSYKNVDFERNKDKIKFINSCSLSVEGKKILIQNIENLSLDEMKEIENDLNNEKIDSVKEIKPDYSIENHVVKNVITEESNNEVVKINEERVKDNQQFEKRFCTKCGKEINADWDFCNYCGNKLK